MLKDIDYDICRCQAQIYEYAVQEGYDLSSFSELYLNSDFCNTEMDAAYSKYHVAYYKEAVWYFMPEIENKIKAETEDKVKWAFAEDIGYMYRLLHILTSIPSRDLCKLISFDYMLKHALLFDHYGFEECALDIIEKFNLPKCRFDSQLTELTYEEAKALKEKFTKRYS